MSSSGASQAQNAADKTEAARKTQVAASTARINQIFSSPAREQQYQSLGDALNQYYLQDANRQKGIADRNLTFSLARSGLTGGSAAADSGTQLADEYAQGLLQAGQKAQSAVSGLRGQDQTTRAQLTQLAQNGLDSTSAASQAAEAMQASIGGAKANAATQGLGDIFGQTSKLYQQQQQNAALRKQLQTPVGSLYGGSTGSYGGP
jgi:hypothetical protein